jgi:hypothetical protein
MIDIHPPHKSEHTWTDFFIHIATICVGLIIAIGLEQTVEAIHHLHQRRELEDNLHAELRTDLRNDATDYRIFADVRAYAVELKSTVSARRAGKPSPPAPPASTDTRRNEVPIVPSLAIWDAAKLDATVALLPSNEIDLYHRIVLQHDLLFNALDDYQHAALAVQSFEERFVDSTGAFDMGYSAPTPNLAAMSPADLTQYETLLAAYIKAADRVVVRIYFFDRFTGAVLDGAIDRNDLIRRAFPGGQLPDLRVPSPATRSATP